MRKQTKRSPSRRASTTVPTPKTRPQPLDCHSLHLAIHRLGESLSQRRWRGDESAARRLRRQVQRVRRDLQQHCAAIESPDGFFESMCQGCPRLMHQIQRLCMEHAALDRHLGELEGRLENASRLSLSGHSAVRKAARVLMDAMTVHQEAGNSLVVEAYNTDLGAGD